MYNLRGYMCEFNLTVVLVLLITHLIYPEITATFDKTFWEGV